METDQNSPFFLLRMRDCLQNFQTRFDILETLAADLPVARRVVESSLWAREIVNCVACEGLNRVGREERFQQWRRRFLQAGFRDYPVNSQTAQELQSRVQRVHPGFSVQRKNEALSLNWKQSPTVVLQVWTC